MDAASFVLGVASTLDWRQSELRLYSGASRSRADFAGTSLAGRIGQGVALLVMDLRGYGYHAHYQRDPGKRGPDFIAQNGATRAFVEAKGAFVAPRHRPDIKAILRDGLEQLKGSSAPGVTKSFVVATFLREAGDRYPEPSLVALVDPDIDDAESEDSPDWVIRENYAGWLRAMGLHGAASDLRGRIPRERGEPVMLWSKNFAGSEFLLLPIDWPPFGFGESRSWTWPSPWFRDARCVVLGLQRARVERLQRALRNPTLSVSDMQGVDAEPGPVSGRIESEGFYGSVMSDGSLMGTIPVDSLFGNGRPEELEL